MWGVGIENSWIWRMWSDFSRASGFNPFDSVWMFPSWCNAEIIDRTQHEEGFLGWERRREQTTVYSAHLSLTRKYTSGALVMHSADPHWQFLGAGSKACHARMRKWEASQKFVLQLESTLIWSYFWRCMMIPSAFLMWILYINASSQLNTESSL